MSRFNPKLVIGGRGPGRPTVAQWHVAHRLAEENGMTGGVYGPHFAGFVRDLLGLSSPRFLTFEAMRVAIEWLRGMIVYKATNTVPPTLPSWENLPRHGGGRN